MEGPPLPISVCQFCPVGGAAFLTCVFCLALTRLHEKVQIHPKMASGAPQWPKRRGLNPLVAFWAL